MSTAQKDAVINTILSVLKERGIDYEMSGPTRMKDVLTSEDLTKIKSIVFEGFKTGSINMTDKSKDKYSDETELKGYVSGVVGNWIKKYPEFNKGEPYVPKNKGSRAGSGDEQIRALRNLKKTVTDTQVLAEIDESIAARLKEIQAEKAKDVEINVDALPEHLKHLVK